MKGSSSPSLTSYILSTQTSAETEGPSYQSDLQAFASNNKDSGARNGKQDKGDLMTITIIVSAIIFVFISIFVVVVAMVLQQKQRKKKLELAEQLEKEAEERREKRRKRKAAQKARAKKKKKEREERRRKQREEEAEMEKKFEDYLRTQIETEIATGVAAEGDLQPRKSANVAGDDDVLKRMGMMNMAENIISKEERRDQAGGD